MLQLLDDALIKYLSLIDDYISLIFMLCETLKKGYFSIAKANYINLYTPRCLAIQENYDKRMKAIYRVNISDQDIQLIELKTVITTKETSKMEIEEMPTNPVHWFGILVPQELRNAQQHFKDGIFNDLISYIRV
ncbi:hypothetical protein PNEG_00846 [Pneumocystis murina B123]|uniref:Vacuolar ATPase assembly protein VMA22 n=1 Tax=Pneumocystis murina (strain B123) TaxID=1069680 RepID=M7PA03_PNEMU|nr:hypothetical protein PNEG_00846 [Pneumocystis murina B123]EMR10695.1 hypothetical protein PNEG_00846 [Pneumocystis murina B123]